MANFANYGNLESILTGYANKINSISEVVPSNATTSNKLVTQSDLPSAVIGNPEGSATAGNLTKLKIGSDIYDVPSGGSGNTVSKTRYQISSSSWSSSANADGYYTATVSLSPSIGNSPDVYVAGSADGTQPTDTEKKQFACVKRCKVNGSTLTLYASSKPSSTFYIWVEGVNGTGSGDIVGNVIQPNGASGGGSGAYIGTVTALKSDFTARGDGNGYTCSNVQGLTSAQITALNNAQMVLIIHSFINGTEGKTILGNTFIRPLDGNKTYQFDWKSAFPTSTRWATFVSTAYNGIIYPERITANISASMYEIMTSASDPILINDYFIIE